MLRLSFVRACQRLPQDTFPRQRAFGTTRTCSLGSRMPAVSKSQGKADAAYEILTKGGAKGLAVLSARGQPVNNVANSGIQQGEKAVFGGKDVCSGFSVIAAEALPPLLTHHRVADAMAALDRGDDLQQATAFLKHDDASTVKALVKAWHSEWKVAVPLGYREEDPSRLSESARSRLGMRASDFLPTPFVVNTCGFTESVTGPGVPEDWVGRRFENGEELHAALVASEHYGRQTPPRLVTCGMLLALNDKWMTAESLAVLMHSQDAVPIGFVRVTACPAFDVRISPLPKRVLKTSKAWLAVLTDRVGGETAAYKFRAMLGGEREAQVHVGGFVTPDDHSDGEGEAARPIVAGASTVVLAVHTSLLDAPHDAEQPAESNTPASAQPPAEPPAAAPTAEPGAPRPIAAGASTVALAVHTSPLDAPPVLEQPAESNPPASDGPKPKRPLYSGISDASQAVLYPASLLQKSIRRGKTLCGVEPLVYAVRRLARGPRVSCHVSELQYQRVSATRMLVWKLFISALEDVGPFCLPSVYAGAERVDELPEQRAAENGQGTAERGQEVQKSGQPIPENGQGTAERGQDVQKSSQPTSESGRPIPESGQGTAEKGQAVQRSGQPIPESGASAGALPDAADSYLSLPQLAGLALVAQVDEDFSLPVELQKRVLVTALRLQAFDGASALWPWRGWKWLRRESSKNQNKVLTLEPSPPASHALDRASADIRNAIRSVLLTFPVTRGEKMILLQYLAGLNKTGIWARAISPLPAAPAETGPAGGVVDELLTGGGGDRALRALRRARDAVLNVETELAAVDTQLKPASLLFLQAGLRRVPTDASQHSLRSLAEEFWHISSGVNARALKQALQGAAKETYRFLSFVTDKPDADTDVTPAQLKLFTHESAAAPQVAWASALDGQRLTVHERNILRIIQLLQAHAHPIPARLRVLTAENRSNAAQTAAGDAVAATASAEPRVQADSPTQPVVGGSAGRGSNPSVAPRAEEGNPARSSPQDEERQDGAPNATQPVAGGFAGRGLNTLVASNPSRSSVHDEEMRPDGALNRTQTVAEDASGGRGLNEGGDPSRSSIHDETRSDGTLNRTQSVVEETSGGRGLNTLVASNPSRSSIHDEMRSDGTLNRTQTVAEEASGGRGLNEEGSSSLRAPNMWQHASDGSTATQPVVEAHRPPVPHITGTAGWHGIEAAAAPSPSALAGSAPPQPRGRPPTQFEARTAFLQLFGSREAVSALSKEGKPTACFVATAGSPKDPFLVQKVSGAAEVGDQTGRHGLADAVLQKNAVAAYLTAVGKEKQTRLPTPPVGFGWVWEETATVRIVKKDPVTATASSGANPAADEPCAYQFLARGVPVKPFDASALLVPCNQPSRYVPLPSGFEVALRQALYVEERDLDRDQPILELLAGLEAQAEAFRSAAGWSVHDVYAWTHIAKQSTLPTAVWRDMVIKLATREGQTVEVRRCARDGTKAAADALQQLTEGVLLRVLHALQALYPAVLRRKSDLSFSLVQNGAQFVHLQRVLHVLAFGSYDDGIAFLTTMDEQLPQQAQGQQQQQHTQGQDQQQQQQQQQQRQAQGQDQQHQQEHRQQQVQEQQQQEHHRQEAQEEGRTHEYGSTADTQSSQRSSRQQSSASAAAERGCAPAAGTAQPLLARLLRGAPAAAAEAARASADVDDVDDDDDEGQFSFEEGSADEAVSLFSFEGGEEEGGRDPPKAGRDEVPEATTALWPHQAEGVDRVLRGVAEGKRGFADASAVGAGKTLTALATCLAVSRWLEDRGLRRHGFLVLVPNNDLIGEWVQQALLHTSGLHVVAQQHTGYLISRGISNSGQRPTAHRSMRRGRKVDPAADTTKIDANTIVVSTLGRVRDKPFVKQPGWDLVVIDECLSVQNDSALHTMEAWRQVSASRCGVLMLSATFFRSRMTKLFYMIRMLRSALPRTEPYLPTLLAEHVICYLPQRVRTWQIRYLPVPLTPEARAVYDASLAAAARGHKDARQVYGDLKAVLRQHWEPTSMLAAFGTECAAMRQLGRRPLVFANSEAESRRLIASCDGVSLADDNDARKKRGPDQQPEAKPLCVTTQRGAHGLNLQDRASAVVCRPQPGDLIEQMKGRVDRPGQEAKTLVLTVIYAENTVEEAEAANIRLCGAFFRQYIDPLSRLFHERAVEASVSALTKTAPPAAAKPAKPAATGAPAPSQDPVPRPTPDLSKVTGRVASEFKRNVAGEADDGAKEPATPTRTTRPAAKPREPAAGAKKPPAKKTAKKRPGAAAAAAPAAKKPAAKGAGRRGKRKRSSSSESSAGARPGRGMEEKAGARPGRGMEEKAGSGPGRGMEEKAGSGPGRGMEEKAGSGPGRAVEEKTGVVLPVPPRRMTAETAMQALEWLTQRDSLLAGVIAAVGPPLEMIGQLGQDPALKSLIRSIIFQQISIHAASAIQQRVLAAIGGEISAEKILATDRAALEKAGLSKRKTDYVRNVAEKFASGELSDDSLSEMSDDEVLRQLCSIKGMGEWSSHMFMMFKLGRSDILPVGDIAVQKAFQKLYSLSPHDGRSETQVQYLPSAAEMQRIAEPWRPYRTIGTWYMWHVVETRDAAYTFGS
ncbi:putative helicase [Diplonema papillatum]|nr:putative helicase [Diplonema papillatum]